MRLPVATVPFFGLLVRTEIPLWGESTAAPSTSLSGDVGGEPDVEVVERGADFVTREPAGPASPQVHFDLATATVRWPGIGCGAVHGGRRIELTRERGADLTRWSALLRTIALPVALGQRGRVVLHGSSVRLETLAVSVLGPSRAGKSTLARALEARGGALVSDGITVVERRRAPTSRSEVAVWPGPASYRLWPDAIAHFGGSPETYPPAMPGFDKRAVPALDPPEAPVRLARIYVLANADEERLESLTPASAAVALTQHTFLAEHCDPASRPLLFRAATALARQVPVARLFRRLRLDRLAPLVDLIQADLREVEGAAGRDPSAE